MLYPENPERFLDKNPTVFQIRDQDGKRAISRSSDFHATKVAAASCIQARHLLPRNWAKQQPKGKSCA